MKRVLIVASVISFIEWFNRDNVEFLRTQMNCEVHIACDFEYMSDTDIERTVAYIQQLKSEGITLHQIGFDRSPLGKRNVRAYRQLRQLITDIHFDLIHCHTPTASVLLRLAARKCRKSGTVVMYTCHGFHFHNASSKINWLIYYPVEKLLSGRCDYLVTINREDYERAKSFRARNVRYIPGVGVDLKRIKTTVVDKDEMKQSIGIPRESIMVLSVGELIERKNHEVIIRALAKLQKEEIYYVICGKGPLREQLEELAKSLGIGEKVVFLGFRTDIPELCNTADISAFPSIIEGLGLAGIEAMAAGVPLVSSNVHGILDYVKDGETGYACAPDDVDAFAAAIEELADNPELRLQMKSKCQSAVEPFDLQNALGEMWSIYREILSV